MSPFYESPLQVSARLAAKVEREAYERGLDAGRRESQAELADLRERAELLSKSWDTEVEDANQGYLTSEDDPSKFIGAELRQIVRTDQNRTATVIHQDYDWDRKDGDDDIVLDSGDAIFIDLETDQGVFQFVAYNSHNGYYGHEVTIRSRQLELSEHV